MAKKKKQSASISPFISGLFGGIAAILGALVFLDIAPQLQQGIESQGSATLLGDLTVQAIDVSDIVEKVNPGVVSILVTQDVPVIERFYVPGPFGFSFPEYRQEGIEEQEIGSGSGFIISNDGYIVTNAHVLSEEDAYYTVFLNDEREYEAKIIASDDYLDIAVLKIEPEEDLVYLDFGDSEKLRLGEGVIAIGNALGEYRNTVSTGVISGLSRSIIASSGFGEVEELDHVIQTDAAINPGNSGGPLLNLRGEVIGVNVAVASDSENIGFALPANSVNIAVDSMIEHGKVIRPYLGVRYIPITPGLAELNNLSVNHGALIIRGDSTNELAVIPGSPADKAGIVENDIILEINGEKVDFENTLADITRSLQVGDEIEILLLHDGDEKVLTIILEEMP